jgi:hypothetical protein
MASDDGEQASHNGDLVDAIQRLAIALAAMERATDLDLQAIEL